MTRPIDTNATQTTTSAEDFLETGNHFKLSDDMALGKLSLQRPPLSPPSLLTFAPLPPITTSFEEYLDAKMSVGLRHDLALIKPPLLPPSRLLAGSGTVEIAVDTFKALGFIGLEVFDSTRQIQRELKELTKEEPSVENPGVNFNYLRPKFSKHGLYFATSAFELTNTGIMITRAAFENLNPVTNPTILAQDQRLFNRLVGNGIMVPSHRYSNTTVQLGAEYIYATSTDKPFSLFMSILYGGAFYSRALFLPGENQRLKDNLLVGIGCTPDTGGRFQSYYNFDSRAKAAASCDEWQAIAGNGLPWLTNSNDVPEYERTLEVPRQSKLGAPLWTARRFGSHFMYGEQLNAGLGFFEATEPDMNVATVAVPLLGDVPWPKYVTYGVGAALLPLSQIYMAEQMDHPLDDTELLWTLGGDLGVMVESIASNDRYTTRAFGGQNLAFAYSRVMPENFAALYEINDLPNSDITKRATTAFTVGGGATFFLGGSTFMGVMADGNTAERVVMGLAATGVHGLHTWETRKYATQLDDRLWDPFAVSTGAFVGGALLKAISPYWKPLDMTMKFFDEHVDVNITGAGVGISLTLLTKEKKETDN